MKPQKLKVNTLNRVIRVRGIPIRTPFDSILQTEKEVSFMKSLLHGQGITDYTIEPIEETIHKSVVLKNTVPDTTSTPKRKPNKTATTILEKIAESE